MAQEEMVVEMPVVIPKVFYMVLLGFGIAFYLIWGAMFNAWTDIAVYTVAAITVGFGLIGTLLYNIVGREEAAD
jgi:hypothetical protein